MITTTKLRLKDQLLARCVRVTMPREAAQSIFFSLLFFLYPVDRLLSVYIALADLPSYAQLLFVPLGASCILSGFLWLYTLELENAKRKLELTLPRGIAHLLAKAALVSEPKTQQEKGEPKQA